MINILRTKVNKAKVHTVVSLILQNKKITDAGVVLGFDKVLELYMYTHSY
jgi:hypothetical protein